MVISANNKLLRIPSRLKTREEKIEHLLNISKNESNLCHYKGYCPHSFDIPRLKMPQILEYKFKNIKTLKKPLKYIIKHKTLGQKKYSVLKSEQFKERSQSYKDMQNKYAIYALKEFIKKSKKQKKDLTKELYKNLDDLSDLTLQDKLLQLLGIDLKQINIKQLKASQNQINLKKTVKIAESIIKGKNTVEQLQKGITISNDNYIVDGHHRWAAIKILNLINKIQIVYLDVIVLKRTFKEAYHISINHPLVHTRNIKDKQVKKTKHRFKL
jgi:hypothetical protein